MTALHVHWTAKNMTLRVLDECEDRYVVCKATATNPATGCFSIYKHAVTDVQPGQPVPCECGHEPCKWPLCSAPWRGPTEKVTR